MNSRGAIVLVVASLLTGQMTAAQGRDADREASLCLLDAPQTVVYAQTRFVVQPSSSQRDLALRSNHYDFRLAICEDNVPYATCPEARRFERALIGEPWQTQFKLGRPHAYRLAIVGTRCENGDEQSQRTCTPRPTASVQSKPLDAKATSTEAPSVSPQRTAQVDILCETTVDVREPIGEVDRLHASVTGIFFGREHIARGPTPAIHALSVDVRHVGNRFGLSGSFGATWRDSLGRVTFSDFEFQNRGNKGLWGAGVSVWDLTNDRRVAVLVDANLEFPPVYGHPLYFVLQERTFVDREQFGGFQFGIGMRFDLSR